MRLHISVMGVVSSVPFSTINIRSTVCGVNNKNLPSVQFQQITHKKIFFRLHVSRCHKLSKPHMARCRHAALKYMT